jgi:hypothetical protein
LTEEFPGIVAGLPSSSQEEEKNPVFSLQITVGSSSETIVFNNAARTSLDCTLSGQDLAV